jgi:hypothetical protein
MLDDTPEPYVLRINRCGTRQIIVAPFGSSVYTPSGIPVSSSAQGRNTLFVAQEFIPTEYTFETLLESLWTDISSAMGSGNFSCDLNSREMRPFDGEDLAIIEASRFHELDNDA